MKSPIPIRSSVAAPLLALAAIIILSALPVRAQLGPPASRHRARRPFSFRSPAAPDKMARSTRRKRPSPAPPPASTRLTPPCRCRARTPAAPTALAKIPFSGKLSLREAIDRGLAYNLGAVGLAQSVRQAQGASRVARSALLPNLNGSVSETYETENLKALGVSFQFPDSGLHISHADRTFQLPGRARQPLANYCRPHRAQ